MENKSKQTKKINVKVKILEEKLWPWRDRVDTIQYNSNLFSSNVDPASREHLISTIYTDLILSGDFHMNELVTLLDHCFPFKNFVLLNLFGMPLKSSIKKRKFHGEILVQFYTLYEFIAFEVNESKRKTTSNPNFVESQRLMAMDFLREICTYIISNVNIDDSFFVLEDSEDDSYEDNDDKHADAENGNQVVNLSNIPPSPQAEGSQVFKAWAIFFSKGILYSGLLAMSTAFKYSQVGSYIENMDMLLDSIPPLLFLAINSYSKEAKQFNITSDRLAATLIVSATQMFTSTRLISGSDNWALQLVGSNIMIINVFPVMVGWVMADHHYSLIPVGLANVYICFKDYIHDGSSAIDHQVASLNNFTLKRNSSSIDDYDEYVILLLMEAYIQIPLIFIKFDIGRILDILPERLSESARYVISIIQSNYFIDTQRIVANMIGDVERIDIINQRDDDKLRIQEKIKHLSPTFHRIHEFLWSKRAHHQMKDVLGIVSGSRLNSTSLSKIDTSLVSYIKNKTGIVQLSQFVIYIEGLKSVHNIDDVLSNIDYFLKLVDDLRIRHLLTKPENLAMFIPRQDWLLIPSVQIYLTPADYFLTFLFQSFNLQLSPKDITVHKRDIEKTFIELIESSFQTPWESQNITTLNNIAKMATLSLPTKYTLKNKILSIQYLRKFDSAMFENCLIPNILHLAGKLDGESRYIINLDGYLTVKNFLSIPLFKNLLRSIERLVLQQSLQTKLINLIQSTMGKLSGNDILHDLLALDILDIASAIDDDLELAKYNLYGQGKHMSSILPSQNETIQVIKELVIESGSRQNLEKSHFLRMIQIPFILEKHTDYFNGENISSFFSDCFKYFINERTSAFFPATKQSIFMEFWTSNHFQNEKTRKNSYKFLRQIYDINKGLFWMPLVLHIIHMKEIENEIQGSYLKHYLTLATEMGISGVDAGILFDFFCRWIYPFELSKNRQKLILIKNILQNSFDDFQSHYDQHFV